MKHSCIWNACQGEKRQPLMNKQKKEVVGSFMRTATGELQRARDSYLQNDCAESVGASQRCVEYSVKAVLYSLGIRYSRGHGWDREQFAYVAKRIRQDAALPPRLQEHGLDCVTLARLLLLVRSWSQFYLPLKYASDYKQLPPSEDLLKQQEAELALSHAEECYRAVKD